MSDDHGYESVYSFQARAHRHWCHVRALMLSEHVEMQRDFGATDEAMNEARSEAALAQHSRHEVRSLLVAMASRDDREIVSFGYDRLGLVASLVFRPRSALVFEPVWVPARCKPMFVELLRILERSDLPFADRES
ncbi:hypothetical protein IFT73_04150 [Aeromicrobium sp. CFBP 8757]|uniref:hypothetical protein n=1 Tax=Aeromicrobium sp. CFBP 8757 TaxID=2775288 RepID=UPI00177BD505|nr:hypothetical protein [Aeromicrobium sp. CFBP 8757]MBD8606036.1 hypothetical protein [Aeromicrobium sp. CFBP 8757]